jgi:2-dehydro-3-deoxy-D-arabinonate dehydratase
MQVFRTVSGVLAEHEGVIVALGIEWDDIFVNADPIALVQQRFDDGIVHARAASVPEQSLVAPIGRQEVWAAGVTYYRSRDARMEEASAAGGGDLYARVYEAERPELFFKSTPHRVVGHRGRVRLRADSKWNVPEPELVLAVNPAGRIFGFTIGNDMSSRDIEGENPLYLPQAKMYDGSCALGPGVLLGHEMPDPVTTIRMTIARAGLSVFEGDTRLAQLKRKPRELVNYLFRHNSFPHGVFLMTGTGIIPPSAFTLLSGDEIQIEIEGLGRLCNTVA